MSVKISDLTTIASNNILSSYIPASDIENDITYKISMQSIYNTFLPLKDNNIQLTSHTLSPSDCNSNVVFNNKNTTTPAELIVPRHKRGRIPLGSTINIIRNNIGDVLIIPSSGVTIYPSCDMYLRKKYSSASITKIDLNKWVISGDLANQGDSSSYDPYINEVVLLLHFEDNLSDSSLAKQTSSLVNIDGGGLFSAEAAKFGTYGIRFDGTKKSGSLTTSDLNYSRLEIGSPSGLTAEWTFEMWFKPASQWTSNTTRQDFITGGTRFSNFFDLYYENGNVKFYLSTYDNESISSNGTVVRSAGTISSDWHHIALSRSGSAVRLFLDGNQLGSNITLIGDTSTETSQSISNFNIGGRYDLVYVEETAQTIGAWVDCASIDVDEIRITEACRYTSNFNLPETQFQDP